MVNENKKRSVKLVFTGYDELKINRSVNVILKNIIKFNAIIQKEPFNENISKQNIPKIWGLDRTKAKRKSVIINADFENLKNLINVKTPDGVLVEHVLI